MTRAVVVETRAGEAEIDAVVDDRGTVVVAVAFALEVFVVEALPQPATTKNAAATTIDDPRR